MTISRVDATHLDQVRQLWQQSRHLYHTLGAEDLPALLANQFAFVANDDGVDWGFICLEVEPRPETLPFTAPSRVYLRAVALTRGRSPARDVNSLLDTAIDHLPQTPQGHLVIAYADMDWLRSALFQARFTLAEEIQFFGLYHLAREQLSVATPPSAIELRPCQMTDLLALAQLDTAVFTPLWHFDQRALQEMLLTNRVQLAVHADAIVGYTALATSGANAHLARLAVHPQMQGRGLGKYLLLDSLIYAQAVGVDTVLLNTQVHNRVSQQLYRSVGFRPTGRVTPVLTRLIHPAA